MLGPLPHSFCFVVNKNIFNKGLIPEPICVNTIFTFPRDEIPLVGVVAFNHHLILTHTHTHLFGQ